MKRQAISRPVDATGKQLTERRSFRAAFNDHSTVSAGTIVRKLLDNINRLLAVDFFPNWNACLRYLKTPLAALLVSSAVTFLCGLLVAPQVFLLFAATTCVMTVGLVYPVLAICAVECRIAFPKTRVLEGDVIRPTLVVHNRWPIPVWGLAVQRGFDSCQAGATLADGVSVALAHVPAWSRTEFTWEFTPLRRGVYPKGGVVVTSAFPFGLWTARKNVKVGQNIVAWPRPLNLETRDWNSQRRVHHVEPAAMVAGNESDVTAIRPYESGDAMRDVHWSATARLNELMVKERQRAAESHTRIVLDVHRRDASHDVGNSNAALDWAIRVTAGLCDAYIRTRMPVTLQFGNQQFEVRSSRERKIAMDALAVAELGGLETGLRENSSWRPQESQIRITMDVNRNEFAIQPFAVEVIWEMGGRSERRRVNVLASGAQTVDALRRECQRLSLSFNRRDFRQRSQIR